MRILYAITKSNLGGAQRYVLDLATEAKKRGHEVSVLLGGSGTLVKELERANIRIIPLPYVERDIAFTKEVKAFVDLLKILRRERPEVLHLNSSKMGILGVLAGRILGIRKIIFTSHGWPFNEKRHWLSLLFIEELSWLTVLLSHKTICVSEQVRRDMESKPLIKKKLVVIHNGIEKFPVLSRPLARKELSIKDEEFVVGTLAELHYTKGLDTLLRAINKTQSINLVIVGEGERRQELKLLANTLGISERVSMPGFKTNARELLPAFDLFVLPSRSEGLPYALLEAGLTGLPVVASEVGGIPEVIKDGKNGFLFQKEDYRGLATILQKLKNNYPLALKIGGALKGNIETNFSKTKMFDNTFAVYS